MIRVEDIDHVVLRVSDAEKSVAWYCDLLGFAPVRLEEWRRKEVPFVSVRVTPTFIVDLLEAPRGPGQNVDHLCFVLAPDGPSLQDLAHGGRLDVVEGPTGLRFGARGDAHSLYVRDPDGNVVELRRYV